MSKKIYRTTLKYVQSALKTNNNRIDKLVNEIRQTQKRAQQAKGLRQKIYVRKLKKLRVKLKYYSVITNKLKQLYKLLTDFIREEAKVEEKVNFAKNMLRFSPSLEARKALDKALDDRAALYEKYGKQILKFRNDIAKLYGSYTAKIVGKGAIAAFVGMGVFTLAKKLIQTAEKRRKEKSK